jgi:ABC-type multidrug transport system ATPase subunit
MEISIRNLSKSYPGGVTALEGVSLSITTGLFGLLGPNGAGKTTMMKILATLLEPTSGEVTIGGLDAGRDRTRIRRMLGYLPQEFGAYSRLRAREFLDLMARLGGLAQTRQREARVEEMLAAVGLADAARRKVKALSGGMLRRLGIAQALIAKPALLIVDEPTTGLDPEERIRFRALLQEIGRETVILLSTHIVGDISSTCEGLAILDHGRLLFTGSPQELMARAAGKTWETVAEERLMPAIRERFAVVATAPRGDRLHLRLVGEGNGGVPGLELRPVERPNLEDAYIHFMSAAKGRGEEGGSHV